MVQEGVGGVGEPARRAADPTDRINERTRSTTSSVRRPTGHSPTTTIGRGDGIDPSSSRTSTLGGASAHEVVTSPSRPRMELERAGDAIRPFIGRCTQTCSRLHLAFRGSRGCRCADLAIAGADGGAVGNVEGHVRHFDLLCTLAREPRRSVLQWHPSHPRLGDSRSSPRTSSSFTSARFAARWRPSAPDSSTPSAARGL